MTRPPVSNGFTLVEMLVALTIFALLASAGVGLLRASVDTQQVVDRRLSDLKATERLRLVLVADLAQAQDRPTRAPGGAELPAFIGEAGRFSVVRGGWSNLDDAPRSSLQRIDWRLQDGAVNRSAFSALDGGEPANPAALARQVESMTLRYRGPDGGWSATWPASGVASGQATLPRAVEMTLQRTGEPPLTIIAALPEIRLPAPPLDPNEQPS